MNYIVWMISHESLILLLSAQLKKWRGSTIFVVIYLSLVYIFI